MVYPHPARVFPWLIGFLCLTGTAADSLHAATWPGTAPCNGTLQACIDAQPAGAEVIVDTGATIDEQIVFSKSLSLRGANGRTPRFAPGRGVRASFAGPDAATVSVARLHLQDATLHLDHLGWGNAVFTVEDMRIESSAPAIHAGIVIDATGSATATHQIRLRRNRLRVAAPAELQAAIELRLRGQPVDAELRWNSVTAVGGDGMGILANVIGGSNVAVRLAGNEVREGFGRAGIAITEDPWSMGSSTITARVANNVVIGGYGRRGGGIALAVHNGSIDARIVNNTISNSSAGLWIVRWNEEVPSSGSITGHIYNNLIAYNRWGMFATPALVGGLVANYNLRHGFSQASGNVPAGADDVTANPMLRSIDAPRLHPTSPAIDAGNSSLLAHVPGLFDHDADGLRRRVGGSVDIGAYEFGHRSLLVQKRTAVAQSFTAVADAAIDLDRGARLFPVGNFAVGRVENPHPLGVFDLGDQWWVRNTNGANIANNTSFNLLAVKGSATDGVHQHSAGISNTLDSATLIDWSGSNGSPDRILLFGQATPFGITTNPHPVALQYGAGAWNLTTVNGASFVVNTLWNLYSQLSSPNAFRHTVATASVSSVLDHPLLNDTPCARVHASPLAHGSSNGILFDVDYSASRWRLFSISGSFSAGAQFNIVVVPEQVEQCAVGKLFRDGYESLRTDPVAVPR
jgi:hypothetical protein